MVLKELYFKFLSWQGVVVLKELLFKCLIYLIYFSLCSLIS